MATRTRSISAVVTTGIYCRAGCPASPNRQNVQRYRTSVAAEAAGFRPCLRCRPDRLPPSYTSNGSPDAVQRAVLLISEGALDESTEDVLGNRIGLSGRQLRRLFLDHLGATPSFVARSRRAHFARRLLDESDLAVTEIAFAAGFNSTRQMNRAMLDTFRFTPTELRAKRRQRDRLVADGGLPLRTPYDGSFSFSDMLRFHAARAVPGIETVDGASYRRTITTCGHPGMIDVSDAGDGRHLLLLAHLPTYNALIDDVARVRRIFGLDQPAADRLPALADDELLAPMIAARAGLRLAGAWDRFETAVRIIVCQQISLRGACTILGRMVEAFGTPFAGLDALGLTQVFPTAERIAQAGEQQLASLGMPSARAATIRSFARAYASEEISLEPSSGLDRLVEQLESLPGIGSWTAHCIALRATGHLDAFPAGDLGLRRAAARQLGRTTISAEELEKRAEAWRPYRGVAAMHLWAAL
jgi:AraC family transcriptional regulator, regulatory protein of adaptative response / DNA-3-methyladenine glycosylase II